MTNITQKQYDEVCESYRDDFPYLSNHRYELLTMAAGENVIEIEDEAEALAAFGRTMDSFTQYPRKEIEDIC